MAGRGNVDDPAVCLREQAELALRAMGDADAPPATVMSPEALQQTLHNLRVHQIELEMQNEELRRAQIDLDAARDRYFDLYDLSPLGYVSLSEGALVREANLTAALRLGVPRGELIEAPFSRFIHPEHQDTFYLFRRRLLAGPDGAVCELQMVVQTGEAFWARLEATVTRDRLGEATLRIAFSDITRWKQADEALLKSETRAQAMAEATEGVMARGRMAAYIAHEINNPLMGIKNAFQLLDKAIPGDHPHVRYVGLIHQEIARISRIVRGMYELYKPIPQPPSEIHLETLLQDVAAMLEPKARLHQAHLRVDSPDTHLQALVASDLIRQVLFNLIQNALEASPPQGTVTCRALRRDLQLILEVSDEGNGVSADLEQQIFASGFSTKPALATQMGLGLGLSSSRRLAEGMGGTLNYSNHPSGRGCTFMLDLPMGHHWSELEKP